MHSYNCFISLSNLIYKKLFTYNRWGHVFANIYNCCIAVIHIQLYTYIHAETKSTIMTNEHTSLVKYTSHTLYEIVAKGLCVRGELETEQTATYWSPVPLSLAALLSRSAGLLDRRSWGPIALCWELVLSTASYHQLTDSNQTEHPVAPGYIIVWRPPASCERRICTQFNPPTVKVITWYLRPDASVPWLTPGSKVNMLHNVHVVVFYYLTFNESLSTQLD